MTQSDPMFDAFMQVLINVANADVPGSLLLMSVGLNIVLLVPIVARSFWRRFNG